MTIKEEIIQNVLVIPEKEQILEEILCLLKQRLRTDRKILKYGELNCSTWPLPNESSEWEPLWNKVNNDESQS